MILRREERLKREEEERTRKEREKQVRIKKKKQELLVEETQSFILASNIREYVKAKEKTFKDNRVEMIDFEEWKRFSLNYANELDSSLKAEKEVVDDYREYNYW